MSTSPPAPRRSRSVHAQLAHLPVFVTLDPVHPGQLTVTGALGTPYAAVRVSLRHESEAPDLAQELPAHLLTPVVWTLSPPPEHTFAWVNGYLTARRYTLPRGGLFTPLRLLTPDAVPNPYLDPGEHAAFRAGLTAYLQAVRDIVTRSQPHSPAPLPLPAPHPAATHAS